MWIEVTVTDGNKQLINIDEVMAFSVSVGLTQIVFARSMYGPVYVNGNILPEIKKALSSNNEKICKIGE